jgi:hypothetical protein
MAKGHNLFIAFDLVHPLENYERLARTLATLGSPVKLGSMLWYLDAGIGARDVDAALRSACNPGDSMIVIDASTNFATLHNLPVPGAQLRRYWNAGLGSASSALSTGEFPAVPRREPVPAATMPPPQATEISDDVFSRLR